MPKDKIFQVRRDGPKPFEFNQEVASVFDDMVERSIPFYNQIHQLILDICAKSQTPKNRPIKILDLGCSTGTTLFLIGKFFESQQIDYQLVGVDASASMLEKAKLKLSENPMINQKTTFECADLNNYDFPDSDIVIMNYTLQFIKMNSRKQILNKIYQAIPSQGRFILSEKIHTDDPLFEELFVDLYYDFKRKNGYSELEISQKREALENVLIPMTPKQLLKTLSESGFINAEMLFRWYNFACFLGVKDATGLSQSTGN